MARPRVTLKCVADHFTNKKTERIVEFNDGTPGGPGGLISFTRTDDGRLIVSVYRTDPGVEVVTAVKARLTEAEPVTEDESPAGHEDGDGCAIYYTGYQVETPRGMIDVEDLTDADTFRDRGVDSTDTWYEVDEVAVIGDEVHVASSPA